MAFAQQLMPSIKTFAYMIKESPVGYLNSEQIKGDLDSISAKFIGTKMPKTLKQTLEMTKELKEQCDLLILSTVTGVLDDEGKPLSDKQVVPLIIKTFAKPVIGTEIQVMANGALCTVLRTGQEQGKTSAEMLLKAMQGTPVSQIPIVRNKRGKAMINVTTMKALGIKPDPNVLVSAQLVKTEE